MTDEPPHDEGGDPACWLHDVCDECGALIGDDDEHECASALGDAGTTSADARQHD